MRMNEITADEFKRKLKDPAAQEIADITNQLNVTGPRGYSFNVYNADKELATIIGRPPGMDVETEEFGLIDRIQGDIEMSDHWSWKAWKGDVEEEFACYVVRV